MGIDLKELENLQSREEVPIDFEKMETKMPTSVDKVVSSNVTMVKGTLKQIVDFPKQLLYRFDSLSKFYNESVKWIDKLGKNNILSKTAEGIGKVWDLLFGKKKP